MTTATLPILPEPEALSNKVPSVETSLETLGPSPYLHISDDRIYNPHTDQTLIQGEPHYAELRHLLETETNALGPTSELRPLLEQGWLVSSETDLSRSYRLKYVSLESHTVCNQACYFCPVSVAPRDAHFMPTEMYERIVLEIADLGEPIEAVFMISYNEPTLDKRFVDQVRAIREAGLPPATLTNGTGLTPERSDALVKMGGLRFLSINISTLDRERYSKDRGGDHLKQVLRNLDYAKDLPVGEDMHIVVLGTDNDVHKQDFEAMQKRFEGSRFDVQYWVVNDRAGYLEVGLKAKDGNSLCGCEHMGSRPIHHLHINPRGQCLLCCQDYNETVVVGDLNHQSVREALAGDDFARARRQVYGVEDAADDFICHNCKFALKR